MTFSDCGSRVSRRFSDISKTVQSPSIHFAIRSITLKSIERLQHAMDTVASRAGTNLGPSP